MAQVLADEYDLVGIGFGPANIGLAVALEEMGWSGSALFLERQTAPDWQAEMILDGTDVQHNPLRDFVTPRNPRSYYTFLNFLKENGRLFEYLNLDNSYALRKDYAQYIRWTARHFDRWTAYGRNLVSARLEEIVDAEENHIPRVVLKTSCGNTILAKAVSLAPGRSALVPNVFRQYLGDRVEHFTRYTTALSRWKAEGNLRSVAVVGASQSAIEIVLDLHSRMPDLIIHNIQRNFGYKLKDTSPFTEEIYFPDFIETFYNASPERQKHLTTDLWRSNYGAADADVIHQLYNRIYEQRIDGRERIQLHLNRSVLDVSSHSANVELLMEERDGNALQRLTVDAVVLATGFKNFGAEVDQEPWHPLLDDIAPHAKKRADGSLFITRDYRLQAANSDRELPAIFVNGLCESSHGFGDAGSFSLLALRSEMIAASAKNAVKVATRDALVAA
ncbi:SidA/IucD/PvdA family monooxygenase [uncultured Bradyrhizobium sp.]|uniref:SidA/IucD/PvdA family monooxygenase n=1 Tax=uncultured Bradyrhizobium sp. TaxID=199684 RepID=UPI0035C9EF67